MFILLFVGGSLDYQKELLIFVRPLQATVMLSLYFAETLLAYATIPLCLEVLILIFLSQRAYTFIFMFILLFVGGSLDYQKELLIFVRPLQATVMLSLYFAETLLAYATIPLCLEVLILIFLSQRAYTFIFMFILLFVGSVYSS